VKVLHGNPSEWDLGGRGHVVSIGVYDGVHRGHRHVLGMVMKAAVDGGVGSAVLTFDRHPRAIVMPEKAPKLLTTLGRRIELFQELGIDVVGVLPFQTHVRDLSPEAFVDSVLVNALHTSLIIVGEDFRFGQNRSGDLDSLRLLGERLGFDVEIVDLVNGDGPLSSTRIRQLVAAGDIAGAAIALGRPFELPGRVVGGDGRGTQIGIPTANLDVPLGLALPGRGVYAVRMMLEDGFVPGVANVGVRPTFGGTRETVEVHVLDWEGEIYGKDVTVCFEHRIRDERKFASVDHLVKQIGGDVAEARRLLQGD
jgi:riboflavin kinase/FMN adenylyltransferase